MTAKLKNDLSEKIPMWIVIVLVYGMLAFVMYSAILSKLGYELPSINF